MTIGDIVQKVKGWLNKQEQPQDDDQPRTIRDRKLESLEREYQYYQNQIRKKQLTEALQQHKRELVQRSFTGESMLGEHLRGNKVDVMANHNCLLRQRNLILAKKRTLKQR